MWGPLTEKFRAEFAGAGEPRCFRAPGRVNLIGEHTDYNGLPVLPMTIAQEIRIAAAPRADGRIVLCNTNPAFPPLEFENNDDLTPSAPGSWDNYAKAAVAGINQSLAPGSRPGFCLLAEADLPNGAGLSSSSALVVACALAYMDALGLVLEQDLSRLKLAALLAEAEHFVGTRGGGMDQAVILAGAKGHACKIDFFPLRVETAPLPDDCEVVVCDSMVKAQKSGAARLLYNMNPRLCHLGCALVKEQITEEFGEEVAVERLGDLWYGPLCLTTREAEALFARAVPQGPVTLGQISKRLRQKPEKILARWLEDVPVMDGGYDILSRLRHQAAEYRRVETARDALAAGDSAALGRLMNESHESCRDNLGVSTPELDRLTTIALEAGALGARLTGAGFGGATVNLVPVGRVERFIETVGRRYHGEYLGRDGDPPIFVAQTSPGAGPV
jgi:N-acetylgalactosamine kinase